MGSITGYTESAEARACMHVQVFTVMHGTGIWSSQGTNHVTVVCVRYNWCRVDYEHSYV